MLRSLMTKLFKDVQLNLNIIYKTSFTWVCLCWLLLHSIAGFVTVVYIFVADLLQYLYSKTKQLVFYELIGFSRNAREGFTNYVLASLPWSNMLLGRTAVQPSLEVVFTDDCLQTFTTIPCYDVIPLIKCIDQYNPLLLIPFFVHLLLQSFVNQLSTRQYK